MSKGSMLNESRFADLMGKVADEQRGFYNEKKQHEMNLKQTSDMAKQKV